MFFLLRFFTHSFLLACSSRQLIDHIRRYFSPLLAAQFALPLVPSAPCDIDELLFSIRAACQLLMFPWFSFNCAQLFVSLVTDGALCLLHCSSFPLVAAVVIMWDIVLVRPNEPSAVHEISSFLLFLLCIYY